MSKKISIPKTENEKEITNKIIQIFFLEVKTMSFQTG